VDDALHFQVVVSLRLVEEKIRHLQSLPIQAPLMKLRIFQLRLNLAGHALIQMETP